MATDVVGQAVLDVRGEKIGTIERMCAYGNDEPKWAVVKIGMLGIHSSLVPLHDAEEDDGGLRVVYEKEHVKKAPSVDSDDDQLGEDDVDLLHRYYGLERISGLTAPDGEEDDIELPRDTREAEPPGMKEGPDSPLTKRRRLRAEELGVPSANGDGDERDGDDDPEEIDVSEARTPTAELPDSEQSPSEGSD
jgi:hypothetical protein